MSKFLYDASYAVGVIAARIRRNPVLVGTAALWAVETLAASDVLTWQGALTVLTGFLVRSQVVPAREVVEIVEDATEATEAGYL